MCLNEEADGELSSLSQVKSDGEAAGDDGAEGGGVRRIFLKEIFLKLQEDVAKHRIGSGCALSQQLVTQTALSRVSGAQLSCRGSADRMVRFRSFAVQPEARFHRRVCRYQADKLLETQA